MVAQTQPGGRGLERRLKQHGAARRCEVCKAVSAYQAGELPAADAMARAGWERSNPAQRSLLLDIFGLSEAPPELAAAVPAAQAEKEPAAWHSLISARGPGEPEPRPRGQSAPPDPVLAAAVAELERGWLIPQPVARPPPEPELEAGL